MLTGTRPTWITFDCYGTLVQWDEGLRAAVAAILAGKGTTIDEGRLIATYDRHEHALEQAPPHRAFRAIVGEALERALRELGAEAGPADAATLVDAISRMPPFPEVVDTLATAEAAPASSSASCRTPTTTSSPATSPNSAATSTVSITAEQAQAYKPSRRIFDLRSLRPWASSPDEVVHVCASPHLDLVATRDARACATSGSTAAPAVARPTDYRPHAVLPRPGRVAGAVGSMPAGCERGKSRTIVSHGTRVHARRGRPAPNDLGDIDRGALRPSSNRPRGLLSEWRRVTGSRRASATTSPPWCPGAPTSSSSTLMGWPSAEVTASSLLVCDFDGSRPGDGEGRPEATAFFIHARLHKRLPRARAAFHTHMPNATALSMVEGDPLAWAGQTALKFYGRTAVDDCLQRPSPR